MILIADGGSTKTDWCAIECGTAPHRFETLGLNPYHRSEEEIARTLREELLPRLQGVSPVAIRFYGAGCTATGSVLVSQQLSALFPEADVAVESDLKGACIALYGEETGIAAILGTGSNSCVWNGKEIVAQIPSLGYVLGDEGSGASLGRAFLSDALKGLLPVRIKEELLDRYALTESDIIERVYRQPMPARFLAGFAPFIAGKLDIPEVYTLVRNCFDAFFRRTIARYDFPRQAVRFTGSVAYFFQSPLTEAARDVGFDIERIERTPLEGIVRHFTQNERPWTFAK